MLSNTATRFGVILFLSCIIAMITPSLALEYTIGPERTVPVPGDYDGDGRDDPAVFSSTRNEWCILESSTGQTNLISNPFGLSANTNFFAVPGDYDGDGTNDLAVMEKNDGYWYIVSVDGAIIVSAMQWGWSGAIPVSGDYDGDGTNDLAVYDSNTGSWYVYSLPGEVLVWGMVCGSAGNEPVSGDYNGDGTNDLNVFDVTGEQWLTMPIATGVETNIDFFWADTIPAKGDYDGDGTNDPALYSEAIGTWYILLSSTGQTNIQQFSYSGGQIVPADYDGDGKTDLALYCATNAMWRILESSTGQTNILNFAWKECSFSTVGSPTNHGNPSPNGYGEMWWYSGPDGTITNTVNSPADEVGGIRYACTGWTATGMNPTSGIGTSAVAVVSITSAAVLTWHWETEYFLDTTAGANGTVDTMDSWHRSGTGVTITAIADSGYHFKQWTGNVPGGSENDNPLTVTMNQSRAITAQFERDTGTITINLTPDDSTWTVALYPPDYSGPKFGGLDLPITEVPTGVYRIDYGDLVGYWTPTGQTRTVSTGEYVPFTGVYIANQEPIIDVSVFPTCGVAPLRVTFDFLNSYDPDGDIARCEIDKDGDGVFESAIDGAGRAIIEYAAPGTYLSATRILDGCGGLSDTSKVAITVFGQSPSAVIEVDQSTGPAPLTVIFSGTNSTTSTNQQIVAYEWDFDGNGVYDLLSTTGVVSWVYHELGTNNATLRITDSSGLQDTNSVLITIGAASGPPSVTLECDKNEGYIPLAAFFTADATDDGAIVEYWWDVNGDGEYDSVTTTNTLLHTYTMAGTFVVKVTVLDDSNLSASDTLSIRTSEHETLKVWISTPKDGASVWGTDVSVHAETAPGKLTSSVQLQYREASTGTWINLDEVMIPPPNSFKTTWDVTALTNGADYDIRAVATNTSSSVVTSEFVTVTIDSSPSKQIGKIVEENIGDKHKKQETFSKDETATIVVYDGTSVIVPLGSLVSNATVEIEITGVNTNPSSGSSFGQACINENRIVALDNNPELEKTITIEIPYNDDDDDGIVDNTIVSETTLTAHYYDEGEGKWKKALNTEVHTKENKVIVKTYHLTEFGLFGSMNLLNPVNGGVLESFSSEYTNTMSAMYLTDGNTVSFWRSKDNPSTNQVFMYSFTNHQGAIVTEALIHNYGEEGQGQNNYSSDFELQLSMDGSNYWTAVSDTLLAQETPQSFNLGISTCRYVRLVVSNGVNPSAWELAEFALHGVTTNDADVDLMPDSWEWQYFNNFDNDGTNDFDSDQLSNRDEYLAGGDPTLTDTDGDGLDDWEEWIAGTILSDPGTCFKIEAPTNKVISGEGYIIYWDSVSGRTYDVLSRTNFTDPSWTTNVFGIVGDDSRKAYTNSEDNPHKFFRINVIKP